MTSNEPLFEGGPTLEQIATTPGAWHVPEHLRDHYIDATTRLTHRQITDAHTNSRYDMSLTPARDHARWAAGLPPIGHNDINLRDHPDQGWPPAVHTHAGYLLHLQALNTADTTERMNQWREQHEQQQRAANTCHVCDSITNNTKGGLCGRCRTTAYVIVRERLEATANERITKLKTRRQLVENYLDKNPDRAPANLYQAIMATENYA